MNQTDRAVLWDLDGTLVDTEEAHWLSWQEVLGTEGVAVTREQFLKTFGRTNASFLPDWLGPNSTPEDVARVEEAKEACYRRILARRGVIPLPGAAEWLERLHREGWRQAIASSAPRLNVETMIAAAGLAAHLDAFVSADDVTTGKPDPEVFLKAAARLGVAPQRSVVVEDAAAGVEGAHRAGMRAIGVRRGRATLGADMEVLSLSDLAPDAFERLIAR